MCIRDRSWADPKAATVVAKAIRDLAGTGSGTLPPITASFDVGTRAVSYTHLRAHETVLDLVCRLLLAKKKNTQHTHTQQHTQLVSHTDTTTTHALTRNYRTRTQTHITNRLAHTQLDTNETATN